MSYARMRFETTLGDGTVIPAGTIGRLVDIGVYGQQDAHGLEVGDRSIRLTDDALEPVTADEAHAWYAERQRDAVAAVQAAHAEVPNLRDYAPDRAAYDRAIADHTRRIGDLTAEAERAAGRRRAAWIDRASEAR